MFSRLCLVLLLMWCYQTNAEESESMNADFNNNSTRTRTNYTANDLIQLLSRLAKQEIVPRLRFPTDDYDDTPDDPFYSDNPNLNPNYIQDQGPNIISNNIKFIEPQYVQKQQYDQQYQQGQNYNQDIDINQPNGNYLNFKRPESQTGQYAQQFQQIYNPNQDSNSFNGNVEFSRPPYTQNGQFGRPFHQGPSANSGQFYRPQRKRKPKKRPNGYRPPFPISQDPLDPYLQNYPPYPQSAPGGYYQDGSRPGYQQNYPTYPQDPYLQGNIPQGNFPQGNFPQGNFPQGNFPQGNFPQGPGLSPYNDQGSGAFGSLMNALNSIAKHDDQKCVPRLLCEVAAGGNPSYRQNTFLPSFLNTESLFTLLSALSGSVSPLLVFGRAALLGVTSQGRPQSCRYAYPECPRDPDRLVEYLNNHNGGFFRFFQGLQGLPQDQTNFNGINNLQSTSPNQPQLPFDLSQLTQLLGQINPGQSGQNYQQDSQQQKPFDLNQLSQLIGQFNSGQSGQNYQQASQQQKPFDFSQLSQLLGQLIPGQSGSNYQQDSQQQRPFDLGQLVQLFGQSLASQNNQGQYNQRPSLYQNGGDFGNYQRYPYKYNYQNRGNSNNSNITQDSGDQIEARILTKPLTSFYYDYNRDANRIQNINVPSTNDLYISQSYHDVNVANGLLNDEHHNGLFKFPDSDRYQDQLILNNKPEDLYTNSFLKFPTSSSNFEGGSSKRPKSLFFPTATDQSDNLNLYYPKPLPFYDHTRMIFPDRTGTGNLKFDSAMLAPIYRPDIYRYEAPSYSQGGSYKPNQGGSYYPNQLQTSSSQKKLVYIVRGNGDPNHPEVVVEGRHPGTKVGESAIVAERRSGNSWTFPSPLQK